MFQAPGFLEKLNQIPTDMTLEGMDAYRRLQGADQLLQETNQQAYDVTAEQRPYRLAQLDLANQTAREQLPGIRAATDLTRTQGELAKLGLEEARQIQGPKIDKLLSQYGAEKTKAYLDQYTALGSTMRQAGAIIHANPLGGIKLAREMFENTGHGNMWNPAWDTMDRGELLMRLQSTGKEIQESADKYTQALDLQDSKARAAMLVTKARLDAAERMSNARLENARTLQRQMLNDKAKWAKEDFGNASVRFVRWAAEEEAAAQQAADAGDMAKAQAHIQRAMMYKAEASSMEERALNLATAGAATGNEAKVDIPGVVNEGKVRPVEPKGGPTRVVPQPPVRQPGQAASAPPKITTPQQAMQAGWVLEQDASGNKAYVNPKNRNEFFEVQ